MLPGIPFALPEGLYARAIQHDANEFAMPRNTQLTSRKASTLQLKVRWSVTWRSSPTKRNAGARTLDLTQRRMVTPA